MRSRSLVGLSCALVVALSGLGFQLHQKRVAETQLAAMSSHLDQLDVQLSQHAKRSPADAVPMTAPPLPVTR